MPEYPMPGYLQHTADLGGNFLGGYGAGESAARAQAQLQTEADRTQAELNMQQMQMERQQARQQQMMDLTRAWHEQQANLKQQAIAQQQQRVQLAATAAARKYQAQQSYDQAAQALIQQGVPEGEAYARAAMQFGPAMGMASAPIAAAMRGPKSTDVTGAPAPGGLPGTVLTGGGRWQYVAPQKVPSAKDITPAALATLATKMPELETMMNTPGAETNFPVTYESLSRLKQILGRQGAATAKPLPSRREDLVKDEVYQTKRGPARWDGEKFVRE